jgi:hypothetical protein
LQEEASWDELSLQSIFHQLDNFRIENIQKILEKVVFRPLVDLLVILRQC